MAGGEPILGREVSISYWLFAAIVLSVLAGADYSSAQTMYKYRGEDGEWIYTDRKPAADVKVETRTLESSFIQPKFSVAHEVIGRTIDFIASNEFYAPIEIRLMFDDIVGVEYPHPDEELRWIVAARSELSLLNLTVLEEAEAPYVEYRFEFLPGDPGAQHQPDEGYQVPFSAGRNFQVTQAYPDSVTHQTLDSIRAVDIAMPVGTDVLAARAGVVFEVTSDNYRGGLNMSRDAQAANIIRILHDDGTFSLYAHLNWNSIRVSPGDRVRAGQYIADSGNTGFSSGPHLHFVVQRNTGLQIQSLPVVFKGPYSVDVVPATGDVLTAYH